MKLRAPKLKLRAPNVRLRSPSPRLTQRRLARPSVAGILSTRQGALALAVLCAVAATGILVFAVGRYRQSVQTTARPTTVLVATHEIQKGTPGTVIAAEGLLKSSSVLSTQLSAGAISDAAFLQGKVAVADILPGQQLTLADFGSAIGVAAQLAPDQRAISITLDEAHGDSDVVQTGDRVDVYGEVTVSGQPAVGLLVPGALVLKAAGGAPGASGGSIVLGVSSSQAPLVAYAADNAKVWLILRPANALSPKPGLTSLASVLQTATGKSISSKGIGP
ncbi:MAG: hypothetical protein JO156_03480 [Solirubrobacterales bacterium]|nr:hypothetical protein [Solirubrobacterales bacterium]